ncbi:30S ribosome-binding factor RbfA [Longispora albida]|uniref:30S ribosome-binding factor RbfA n=1 Tax=Longispora albida TaxID=203523 RepID=UPI000381ED2E|nr:30S ribosome-binding factor RbfA [Longispora albida]
MSDSARVRRLAGRVRELVASSLKTQVKDPRLGMVTVTDARLTNDLREATVYYTVLGDPTEQDASRAALESAKGMLRTTVGRRLGLRHSPSITFVADQVQDHVATIDDLLAQANAADAEVHRMAAGAQYAGEANPYKADDES